MYVCIYFRHFGSMYMTCTTLYWRLDINMVCNKPNNPLYNSLRSPPKFPTWQAHLDLSGL